MERFCISLRKISERDSEGARMKKKLFFVDAETDGLYGTFLSIAVIVTDKEKLYQLARMVTY